MCNPHNPCGRLWSREELERMGNICLKYGVPVISDEIHCEIVAPGSSYLPFAILFPQNCITFVSPTKPFSMPGLKIANIISANEDLLAKVKHIIGLWEHGNVNQLGIVALQAAYSPEGAEWLNEMNEVVHANFLDLRERFRQNSLLYVSPRLKPLILPGWTSPPWDLAASRFKTILRASKAMD